MTRIQDLIKEIKNLKPVPAVANKLLAVVDNPKSSMEDLACVIQYDPVITASVLKTCNSAYFGLKNPAESVKDAVNMLGTDQVVELVILKSGAEALSGSQKGYGTKDKDIWQYAASSAVIAKQAAVKLSLKNKNTIFTSALLKDIGKIVLGKYIARSSETIQDLVENKAFSFREAEKKALGIDHAELGAMIAKMWKFSPKMVKIIRHHHLSDETMINDKEIAVVYLSDCICMMMGRGVGKDGLCYRFKGQIMKALDISAHDIAMMIAEFGIKMQKIEDVLHIVQH